MRYLVLALSLSLFSLAGCDYLPELPKRGQKAAPAAEAPADAPGGTPDAESPKSAEPAGTVDTPESPDSTEPAKKADESSKERKSSHLETGPNGQPIAYGHDSAVASTDTDRAPQAVVRVNRDGVLLPGLVKIDDDGVEVIGLLTIDDTGVFIPGVLKIDGDGVVIYGEAQPDGQPQDRGNDFSREREVRSF